MVCPVSPVSVLVIYFICELDKSWRIVNDLVTEFRHNALDYDFKDTFNLSPKDYIFDELQLNAAQNEQELKKCIHEAPKFSSDLNLSERAVMLYSEVQFSCFAL